MGCHHRCRNEHQGYRHRPCPHLTKCTVVLSIAAGTHHVCLLGPIQRHHCGHNTTSRRAMPVAAVTSAGARLRGSGTADPAGHSVLSGHGVHVCCPGDAWLVPAAHGVHEAAPSDADTEPGAHAKHDDDTLPPDLLL